MSTLMFLSAVKLTLLQVIYLTDYLLIKVSSLLAIQKNISYDHFSIYIIKFKYGIDINNYINKYDKKF